MAKRTCTTFACNGCGTEQDVEDAYLTVPMNWRMLTWNSGYMGDEKREAYFCPTCAPKFLQAIDALLEMNTARRPFTSGG